jgi:hypothetical protein
MKTPCKTCNDTGWEEPIPGMLVTCLDCDQFQKNAKLAVADYFKPESE